MSSRWPASRYGARWASSRPARSAAASSAPPRGQRAEGRVRRRRRGLAWPHTDIAPAILDYAEHEARAAGLANVAVRAMDAEGLDGDPGTFDAAVCRLGLMYLPSLQAALEGVRRALRPGGCLAAIVFSTPDRKGFFSVPVGIIRRHAGTPASARRRRASPGRSASALPACSRTR